MGNRDSGRDFCDTRMARQSFESLPSMNWPAIRLQLYAAITSAVVFGIPAWFLFDRTPPVTRLTATIEHNPVRPGQQTTVDWLIEARRDCAGKVTRVVIDHAGVP